MKRMIAVVAVAGLVMLAAVPADARGRGGGGRGGGSQGSSQGVRSGGGHHHGGHGHRFHGSGHGHRFHGSGHGHRFHGHRFRSSFVVGTGVWVGPYWGPYWGGPYWYPPYAAYPPAYAPVVIETQPQTYIQQQAPASSYWYYCEDARAYYPYVKECPAGWLTVVPHATPETQR